MDKGHSQSPHLSELVREEVHAKASAGGSNDRSRLWILLAVCLTLTTIGSVGAVCFLATRPRPVAAGGNIYPLVLMPMGEQPTPPTHGADGIRYDVANLPKFATSKDCRNDETYDRTKARDEVREKAKTFRPDDRLLAIAIGTHDIRPPKLPLTNPTLAQMRARCAREIMGEVLKEPEFSKLDVSLFEVAGGATDPDPSKTSEQLEPDRGASILLISLPPNAERQ